jgi:hypothetical protein
MDCLSRGQNVAAARLQIGTGAPGVVLNQVDGALGVTSSDRCGDRLVLVPDRFALAHLLQRRSHDAAQMHPMRLGTARDQRVAGRFVDGVVKGDVGFDHGLDVATARGTSAGLYELGVEDRAPARGETGGERVERGADLVDLGDPLRLERRHQQAPAGRVVHQAVLLQQPQRLQHRLARDRQPRRDRFLGQPFARRERAVVDRVQQCPIDPVDQIGRLLQPDEMSGHRRLEVDSELCIQNAILLIAVDLAG